MDLASSRLRLSASTLPMSGLGAPARTDMPIKERTRSTRLPATTLPSPASASSAGAAEITTSARSLRASRLGMASGALPIDAP